MRERSAPLCLALAMLACGTPRAAETPETQRETARETAPHGQPEPPPVVAAGERRPPPGGGRVQNGFFVAEGAPDPLACTTDADCTASQTLDATGCCGTYRDMAAAAQSVAYRDWQDAYHAAHCADFPCPSPPVPSAPPDCLFQVRCDEGRCDNACPW